MSMTITSDGRQFVYGVFGADGCECENLEAVFGSETEAQKYKETLLSGPLWEHKRAGITPTGQYYADDARFYGRADLLEVRALEVGKPTRTQGI